MYRRYFTVFLFLSFMACAASVFLPAESDAFFEDLCYEYTDTSKTALKPQPFNCWDVQCKDNVKHSNTQCVTTGLEGYLTASISDKYHARNSLHFDVVWLLARLNGMTIQDASMLAAYSEATDPGGFTHYDYLGYPIPSTNMTYPAPTDNIIGVHRTNDLTYGYWFHYIPWYKLPGMTATTSHLTYTPGAIPSPFPAQEVPVNHLRAWAFGKRDSLCEFGLTKDIYSDTAACINDGVSAQKGITVHLPFMANLEITATNPAISWQHINPSVSPPYNCVTGSNEPAPCYNDYNAAYAGSIKGTVKALGIYLHAMDDRLSHFACVDPSFIALQNDGNYVLQYHNTTCEQGTHAILHYAETGHVPIPQRSLDAIRFSYYEIAEWMNYTGYDSKQAVVNSSNYPGVNEVDKIVEMIGTAITRGISRDRIKALCKTAVQGYNLGWHDGNSDCKY